MRPHDLTPVDILAAKHEHGSKVRYMNGCRCRKCRAGNATYEARLNVDRFWFGPNNLVPTDEVQRHLKWLASHGIGHKTVAKVCGVGKSTLADILWYGKAHIRRRRALRVLSLQPTLDIMPKTHKVQAGETLAKLQALAKMGIPRATVSRDGLGNMSALQACAKPTVIVRTAIRLRDYYERVMAVNRLWVSLHGPIPPRHYVYWKRGCRGLTWRSVELRPFSSTYDFNNTWPEELKEAKRLLNRVRETYRTEWRKQHGKEHNARPA